MRRGGQDASAVFYFESVAGVQNVDQQATCEVGNSKWNRGGVVRGIDGDDDRTGRLAANERELLGRDVKLDVVAGPQRCISTADRDQRFYQPVQFRMARMVA